MIGLNHYSELLKYLKQLALEDEKVKSVTQGIFDDLDLKKGQERNLVHVSVTGGSFGTDSSTVNFNIQLGAFADRRTYNLDEVDGFYGNTNEVDNLNTTLAIINRMWSIMVNDFQEADIDATDTPTLLPYWNAANDLDGWILNFEVEMPNNVIKLCE